MYLYSVNVHEGLQWNGQEGLEWNGQEGLTWLRLEFQKNKDGLSATAIASAYSNLLDHYNYEAGSHHGPKNSLEADAGGKIRGIHRKQLPL